MIVVYGKQILAGPTAVAGLAAVHEPVVVSVIVAQPIGGHVQIGLEYHDRGVDILAESGNGRLIFVGAEISHGEAVLGSRPRGALRAGPHGQLPVAVVEANGLLQCLDRQRPRGIQLGQPDPAFDIGSGVIGDFVRLEGPAFVGVQLPQNVDQALRTVLLRGNLPLFGWIGRFAAGGVPRAGPPDRRRDQHGQ